MRVHRVAALLLVPILLAGCLTAEPTPERKKIAAERVVIAPRAASEFESQLSAPRFTGIVTSTAIATAKDGTELTIDLYQPAGIGDEKMPTFLVLSPYWAFNGYNKEAAKLTSGSVGWFTPYFTSRGYTVALADMRGTRNSSGCFDFGGAGDQQDGYAIVEWLGTQPWSNGKVGMYGVSHVGMSQVAAAVANPPHLTTIVPIAAIHSFYRYLYFGGAHYDLNMFTPPAYTAVATLPPTHVTSPTNFAKSLADTGCRAAEYNVKGTSQDGRFDAFWRERDYPDKAANVNASIFFVHGLIDGNVKFDHVDAMWRAMAARPDGPFIKAHFGQWGHSEPSTPGWRLITHRWMDHWLLGIDTGMLDEPRVTIQASDRTWRNETQWPSREGEATLYLATATLQGEPVADGSQSFQDVPFTTRGRERAGEFLLYESDALAEPIHVSGTPNLLLQAASDKPSTHWAVLAYDVAPSGAATLWDRGYLDSKQRGGLDKDEPLMPGQRTEFNVSLFPIDYVLQTGHKLRLTVKSTDACGYVVEAIAFQCGPTGIVSDTTAARNTVYYGGTTGSRLVLPTTDGVGVTG